MEKKEFVIYISLGTWETKGNKHARTIEAADLKEALGLYKQYLTEQKVPQVSYVVTVEAPNGEIIEPSKVIDLTPWL